MPKRGQAKPKLPVGDPTDPHGFPALLARYLERLAIRNFSPATVAGRAHYLGVFAAWCAERSLTQPRDVTKPVLDRYAKMLYHYRKEDGQPLSFRSQHTHLVPVRSFFKWLAKDNLILFNPASELELPKLGHRLPKHVLTAAEADQVLAVPSLSDPLGIRDRAILETFYSTGMRRAELIGLKLYDLDVERGTVMIRQGKGQKDRMVPIGERALAFIDKYLVEVRPSLVLEPDDGTIFLTHEGLPFTPNRMTQLVRDHVDVSGIGKRGACHLFRHTMATLMLEGGADIRFIQQMLGHAKLETTQIYTQVSIRQLKAIHSTTHPGAKLRHSEERADNCEAGEDEPTEPTATNPPAAERLAILFAEDLAGDDEPETQILTH